MKRQFSAVSVDGLRAFMAILGAQDVGIFVAAGGFTKEVHREARQQENRRVTLVDLSRLVDLWVEHDGRAEEKARRLLPLRTVHFLAP